MADSNVNDLTAITAANLVDADEFYVFDISGADEARSRKILVSELRKLALDAVTLDYEQIPAASMTPRDTDGAAVATNEGGSNATMIDSYAFAHDSKQWVGFEWMTPLNWDPSVDIKLRIDWTAFAGTAADTVEWQVYAVSKGDNDSIDPALGTPQVISDALHVANDEHYADLPALAVSGSPAAGDIVYFHVARNFSGTDDLAQLAQLKNIQIEFTKTLGITVGF